MKPPGTWVQGATLVRRSLLVVSPLDDGALLNAANSIADAIVVDLVSRGSKSQREEARRAAPSALERLSSSGADLLLWTDAEAAAADLAVCSPGTIAGVVAGVDTPEEAHSIDDALATWEPANNIPKGTLTMELVLASAKAMGNVDQLAAASRRTVALALDDEMLLREMGVSASDSSDLLTYHRGKMAMSARSAGIQAHALGIVGDSIIDRAAAARQVGLRGALCFDSTEVASLNAGFSPSTEEIEAARQVLEAMQVAVDGGRGAVALSSGQMADLANVRGAQAVIAWSEAVEARVLSFGSAQDKLLAQGERETGRVA